MYYNKLEIEENLIIGLNMLKWCSGEGACGKASLFFFQARRSRGEVIASEKA